MANLEKLKKRIDDSGLKRDFIADFLGIDRASLYNKLQGKTEFVVSEAGALKEILNLSEKEASSIFFSNKV